MGKLRMWRHAVNQSTEAYMTGPCCSASVFTVCSFVNHAVCPPFHSSASYFSPPAKQGERQPISLYFPLSGFVSIFPFCLELPAAGSDASLQLQGSHGGITHNTIEGALSTCTHARTYHHACTARPQPLQFHTCAREHALHTFRPLTHARALHTTQAHAAHGCVLLPHSSLRLRQYYGHVTCTVRPYYGNYGSYDFHYG